MALDHFVSRVHLKQFIDLSYGHLLNATRKQDLRQFTPRPHDVCRIDEGNTNIFLEDPRIVERVLRHIEPAYDRCLEDLRQLKINSEIREVFSGFLAFILTCTPTGTRLLEKPTQAALREQLLALEKAGELPAFPVTGRPEYDRKSVAELLNGGFLRFDVNLKMPQAILITRWRNLIDIFCKSRWHILLASDRECFLTSDFPAAVLKVDGYGAARFLPLAPDIGIVVYTDKRGVGQRKPIEPEFFKIGKSKVTDINRHIVRAAESLVFSSHNREWLLPFVRKNQRYYLDISGSDMQLREAIKL